MLLRHLPDEKERKRDDCNHDEDNDASRLEPVEVLALVERDLQRTDPQNQQRKTDAVDRQLEGGRFTLLVDEPGDRRGAEADRNIDVENPRPSDVVRDPPAEQRTDDRRDQRRDRPQGQRAASFLLRIAREQQRLRQRNHRTGNRALNHAKQNQEFDRRREPAQERHNDEEQNRHEEQPHLPVATREPAGQRPRDRVGDAKRRDHPRALIGRHAEAARNRWYRDVGDREVQHVHERRERQRDRAQYERATGQRRKR